MHEAWACTSGPASSEELTAVNADVTLQCRYLFLVTEGPGAGIALPRAGTPIKHPIIASQGKDTCNTCAQTDCPQYGNVHSGKSSNGF